VSIRSTQSRFWLAPHSPPNEVSTETRQRRVKRALHSTFAGCLFWLALHSVPNEVSTVTR